MTDKTEVTVPPDFRKMIEKTLWATILPFRPNSTPYESFIEGLDENEERMKRHRRSIRLFLKDYPVLKAILEKGGRISPDDKNEFYDLWERNDAFLYGSILGEFQRGTLLLPDNSYEGEPFFRLLREEVRVGEDRRPIWVVSKKGARFTTYLMPRRLSDFSFQRQVSRALAYFNIQILSDLLKIAYQDTLGAEVAEEILAGIEKARTRFSRWAVTLAISNAGSRSFAILPFGELVVKTEGLVDGAAVVETSTAIRLELRGEDGEPRAIQVQGGSAALVTFVSTDFIGDHERSEVLTRAYELGARGCRARVFTTTGGFFVRSTLVTREIDFAPTESGVGS